MSEIKRYPLDELARGLTDDRLLRAADEIRRFMAGDGMFAVQQRLELYRRNCTNVLYCPSEKIAPAKYAEVSGAVQSIEKFYEIFKVILDEAEALNRE